MEILFGLAMLLSTLFLLVIVIVLCVQNLWLAPAMAAIFVFLWWLAKKKWTWAGVLRASWATWLLMHIYLLPDPAWFKYTDVGLYFVSLWVGPSWRKRRRARRLLRTG